MKLQFMSFICRWRHAVTCTTVIQTGILLFVSATRWLQTVQVEVAF